MIRQQGTDPGCRNVERGHREGDDVPCRTSRQPARIGAGALPEDLREFRRQLRDLVAEMSPRRSAPRETAYGARYERGEPLPILGPGAELLFTDAGVELIAALAK